MQVTLLKSSESQEKSINRFLMPSKSLFYYYSEDHIIIIILIIIYFSPLLFSAFAAHLARAKPALIIFTELVGEISILSM